MCSGRAIIASNQSFSIIHLRISLSPLPAPPLNKGEPLKIIPNPDCLFYAKNRFNGGN